MFFRYCPLVIWFAYAHPYQWKVLIQCISFPAQAFSPLSPAPPVWQSWLLHLVLREICFAGQCWTALSLQLPLPDQWSPLLGWVKCQWTVRSPVGFIHVLPHSATMASVMENSHRLTQSVSPYLYQRGIFPWSPCLFHKLEVSGVWRTMKHSVTLHGREVQF